MGKPITPEVAQQIEAFVFAGQKIQAIKLYRQYTDEGLKESKDFVDTLETELRTREPGRFTALASNQGCLVSITLVLVRIIHDIRGTG